MAVAVAVAVEDEDEDEEAEAVFAADAQVGRMYLGAPLPAADDAALTEEVRYAQSSFAWRRPHTFSWWLLFS